MLDGAQNEGGLKASDDRVLGPFREQLRAFVLSRVSDRALAEDVLQDAYIKVHQALPSLKDETRVLPWLYRVVNNTLMDHLRQVRPGTAPIEDELVEPEDHDEESDDFDNRMVGTWLRYMMEDLPPKYREISATSAPAEGSLTAPSPFRTEAGPSEPRHHGGPPGRTAPPAVGSARRRTATSAGGKMFRVGHDVRRTSGPSSSA